MRYTKEHTVSTPHATLSHISMSTRSFLYKYTSFSIISSVAIPVMAFAGTLSTVTICPGSPTPVTLQAKSVIGSCTVIPSNSLQCPPVPAFSGQVIAQTTQTQTISPDTTCSYTHACNSQDPVIDGNNVSKQVDATITVLPEQQVCCGAYSLTNYSSWNASLGRCQNLAPGLELLPVRVVAFFPNRSHAPAIAPDGTITIAMGDNIVFDATGTDATADIDRIGFDWIRPSGAAGGPGIGGGTSWTSNPRTFSPPQQIATSSPDFTPFDYGMYTLNFYARDNSVNNFNNYGGPARKNYAPPIKLKVINRVTPTLRQDTTDPKKLFWQCANAQQATLEEVNGGATTTIFSAKTLPPNFGTYLTSSVAGTKYVLTCNNTVSKDYNYAIYYPPTLTTSNITQTSAQIVYDCGDPSANQNTFARTPGYSNTYGQTSRTTNDNGLTKGKTYIYTITCKNVSDGVTKILGVATARVTTISGPTPSFTLQAYVRGVPSDPATYSSTEPITVNSPDGQFDSWSYEVTNGTAAACSMEQASDGGEWYPVPGYATDPVGHTQSWNETPIAQQTNNGSYSYLTPEDKTLFANGFVQNHFWRLTCLDSQNRSASLTWEMKKLNTLPTVTSANLNLTCTPLPATASIDVQCTNSDYFEVNDTSVVPAVRVGFGVGNSGSVPLPGPGTYNTVCKQGGVGGIASTERYLRTFDSALCNTTINSFTISPRTVKSGSNAVVQWAIGRPNDSCVLQAEAVCAEGSGAACDATRQADAAALNTTFQNGQTDINDPNNLSGRRTIPDALQKSARDDGTTNTKAAGKATIKVKYTTDIILKCTTLPAVEKRLRVQVSNDQEG